MISFEAVIAKCEHFNKINLTMNLLIDCFIFRHDSRNFIFYEIDCAVDFKRFKRGV